MINTDRSSKSPLTLLVLLAVMVIATLVVISNYFLRPSMEFDLTQKITKNLLSNGINNAVIYVSGRDVTLIGSVQNHAESIKAVRLIEENWDIHQVENKLVIKNQAIE